MPIKIPNDLPATQILESENIFVMQEDRAMTQDIRPLKIVILNLMPTKITTETQLMRLLGNPPLQVDVELLQMASHQSKNTSEKHLMKFYKTLDEIREERFDGMIVTGAPVEQMPFEEVDYWDELCEVFEWAKKHVYSTMFICWGAQAGLYYRYGIDKIDLPKKLFGIYSHKVKHRREPLVRGFDDYFLIPHSRYTEVPAEALHECKELKILAESDKAGVLLCMSQDGRQIFIFGHAEYGRGTLRNEYVRDVNKGIEIEVPENYFPDDDPSKQPHLQWRATSQNLYSNWLNYYVYQLTPYDLDEIR